VAVDGFSVVSGIICTPLRSKKEDRREKSMEFPRFSKNLKSILLCVYENINVIILK